MRLKRDDATRVHPKRFAFEFTLNHGSTSVNKREPVANKFLKNEALTAEQTRSQFFIERDRYFCAMRRTKKRIFLAE